MEKEQIIHHFGLEFYHKILADLETYKVLWGLYDIAQINYYSVNCLFTCVSKKHGGCVLKIGKNVEETENEYRFLQAYNGRRFCKVYEADTANGALLMERITPGTQLRVEPDLDKRLTVFHEVSCDLHREAADKTIYPTYMDWVSRITEYMHNRKEYKVLYQKMAKAEQVCRRLWTIYPKRMLLHGDLHHDNILLGNDGCYCLIDPKGVIGDGVFDIPRFVLNEFEDAHNAAFVKKYTHITQTLSGKFCIPESDIRCLTYVEMCMANCWNAESAEEPDMAKVLFAEKMMNELL